MATNSLKDCESQLNNGFAVIDAKKNDIENRIDQEKKQADEITKKARDALKGFFR